MNRLNRSFGMLGTVGEPGGGRMGFLELSEGLTILISKMIVGLLFQLILGLIQFIVTLQSLVD